MFLCDSVYCIRIFVFVVCATNVFVNAGNVHFSGNATRYRRQSACSSTEFKCGTGECIIEEKVCDGKEDCPDGADETTDCLDIPCNTRFLFKCAYGACISKKHVCDGVSDCKDSSDEKTPNCRTIIPVTSGPPKDCGQGKFACDSNQCTDETNVCDGKVDCDDGSDETAAKCSKFNCPKTTYRCRYGACVGRNARCNNVRDCVDGSDEEMCTNVTPTQAPVTPSPKPPTPSPKPPTPSPKPPTPTPSPQQPGSCAMPSNPTNGVFTIGDTTPGTYPPGTYVPMVSALIVKCDKNYKPSPPDNRYPICLSGKWTSPPPSCARSCHSKVSTPSTRVSCNLKGRPLESCNDPVEGTIATISCEPLHEEPGISQRPLRVCKDGSWDHPFTQCYPICGEKRPEGVPNIINGQVAKQGDYPWHVAIYSTKNDNQNICGGSLLSLRVVITAAHCVTDGNDGSVFPSEDYLIGAGKYFRLYGDEKDPHAQYSEVESIHVPPRYKGAISQYEADISIIVLKTTFTLSVAVQPVCVDWSTAFEYQQISSQNAAGVIVGWGQTVEGRDPSNELKELDVPIIPYEQCFDQVPKPFRKFITHDKVCAGFLGTSTAVCSGDSGGGLTFPNVLNRYYIRGIVSTSPATINKTCDSNQYGTYTLVSKHIDFVKQHAYT